MPLARLPVCAPGVYGLCAWISLCAYDLLFRARAHTRSRRRSRSVVEPFFLDGFIFVSPIPSSPVPVPRVTENLIYAAILLFGVWGRAAFLTSHTTGTAETA